MKAIWKFGLMAMRGVQGIHIPAGASFLSAQPQGGGIALWFVVDPEAPLVARKFDLFHTGDDNLRPVEAFLATVQLGSATNPYVLHVFDLGEA